MRPELCSKANGVWDVGLMLSWTLATIREGTADQSGMIF